MSTVMDADIHVEQGLDVAGSKAGVGLDLVDIRISPPPGEKPCCRAVPQRRHQRRRLGQAGIARHIEQLIVAGVLDLVEQQTVPGRHDCRSRL